MVGGGIGAGKSALGDALRRLGATVIDADQVGHEVLEPGGAVFDEVAARWPEVVIDGVIDRGRLGRIVFADAGELAALEAITHPAIGRRLRELVAQTDGGLVVVEVPVLGDLLGDEWRRVAVTAPIQVRRRRAAGRGLSDDEIDRRIAAQPSDDEWRAVSEYEVVNDGTLEDLEQRARELVEWLSEKTANS